MGEYEPEDSRDVTLKPGHEPGGIKRTGPREDKARADAIRHKKKEADEDDAKARAMAEGKPGAKS